MQRIASSALFTLLFLAGNSLRGADTYQVDPVHSFVILKITHFGAGNSYGRFNDIAGSVVFDNDDPSRSTVSLTIKADSVDTANAKRDEHLKGPDFFNVKEFPTITFKSTKITKVDDGNYSVTGDLTVKGVTKPITTNFAVVGVGKKGPKGEERSGGEAVFTIKRSDFGITYGPGALGEDVTITVAIEGLKL
jgi:polyisoprenoid-binding protein YceI